MDAAPAGSSAKVAFRIKFGNLIAAVQERLPRRNLCFACFALCIFHEERRQTSLLSDSAYSLRGGERELLKPAELKRPFHHSVLAYEPFNPGRAGGGASDDTVTAAAAVPSGRPKCFMRAKHS